MLGREQLLRRIDALTTRLRRLEARPPVERLPTFVATTRGLSDSLARFRSEYEALLARSDARGSPAAALLAGTSESARVIQQSLMPDEALLEYLVTADEVLIFVVTDRAVAVSIRRIADNLAARVQLVRELLATGGGRARPPNAVLRALYAVLLGPVQESGALRRTTRLVVVVPHGVLTYLPFSALIDPHTGKFVAQQYSVLRVPTGASLWRSGAEAYATRALRPIGRWRSLCPFQRSCPRRVMRRSVCAQSIPARRAMWGVAPPRQRCGSRFARARSFTSRRTPCSMPAIRSSRASSSRETPLALLPDNGRLEMHELLRLTVTSPLVFLSGCETGLGGAWSTPFETGEDYTTVAQALLLAGAANVVATLWRIDDTGASIFAGRFYEAALRMPPPEALAVAQRAMIADTRYSNPYGTGRRTMSAEMDSGDNEGAIPARLSE